MHIDLACPSSSLFDRSHVIRCPHVIASLEQLADRNHAVSKAYGVLLEDEGIALRGTFFIDPKGTLRASHIHDLPVGRSVEETIRVVKAFQFTDEHGEVCPAGWDEGSATIDTKDSSKYFSKQ